MRARRFRRQGRMCREERGVTLPEMVVSVTLLGMVVSVIAGGVFIGLKVPDEGAKRTLAAAKRTLATQQFTDDVIKAVGVKTWITPTLQPAGCVPSGDGTGPACDYIEQSTCKGAPYGADRLFTLTLSDSSTYTYRLLYGADSGATQAATATAQLQRTPGDGVTGTSWQTLVSGYCKTSPADIVLNVLTITSGRDTSGNEDAGGQFNDRRLRAAFFFRDTRYDNPTLVDMDATPRTDCRPHAQQSNLTANDPALPDCEPSS